MDPLSITASIAGIAAAVFQVVGLLSQMKSGGKDRLALCKEVTLLWLSISALQQHLTSDTHLENKIPPHLLPLFAPDGIIKDIETEIQSLDNKLKSQANHGRIRQTLAWPFTQQDVMQAIDRVHRLQQIVHLAMTQSNHALTEEIYRDGQEIKQIVDEDRMKQIIEWISPLDFLAKQKMIFKQRHEGTCQWFFGSESFREWREGEGTVLYGPGNPGVGKTFLSSIVVHELETLRQQGEGGLKDAAIAIIYCKWDDAPSQVLEHLVSSVMKQILQKYSVISEGMLKLFNQHITAGTTLDISDMVEVLTAALEKFPKVFLVVDGLDELLQETDRIKLLRTLTSLHKSVNLMVTSRPLGNITRHFSPGIGRIYCDGCGKAKLQEQMHCGECEEYRNTSFDLCYNCFDQGQRCGYKGHIFYHQFNAYIISITAVEEDLTAYVEWRIVSSDFLQQCVEVKEGLKEKILETVVKRNGGMFLLARFNMDTLNSKLSTKQVLAALTTLPKELDGTYAEAMKRITELPEGTKEAVMDFLRWVVFAEQPLSIKEIEHALAICEGDTDIDDDNIIRARVLADKCAGLVQFDEWDCARLVHFSTQNYFNKTSDQWFPGGTEKLTTACITYLLFDPFKKGACSGPTESADFDARIKEYPFLRYASINWGVHLRKSPSERLIRLAGQFLADTGCLATASQASWYLDLEGSTSWTAKDGSSPLHFVAHFGLGQLVTELIKKGFSPDARDSYGTTPLILAAERGRVDVAKALLQAGASINLVNNLGASPLSQATLYNQVDIVQLLLQEKGIDINIAYGRPNHNTPLIIASMYGYTEIVRLLLSSPALQVNKECNDPIRATALTSAAQYGKLETVQALLTHPDINVNHQQDDGSTALVLAAGNGYVSVVEALLNKGADTEVLQFGTEGTALLRAIDSDHIPVVELLLRRGANVHHKDCFGRGMLHGAACNGRTEIIRILLKFDPTLDVNLQDVNGKTTLHDVARLEYIETAKVLLDHGADPAIKENHGRTPIRIAREMNNTAILDLLRTARERKKSQSSSEDTHDAPRRTDTGTIIKPPERTDTQFSIDDPLPLWALVKADLVDETKKRLSGGPCEEINLADPDMGQSALHYAAANDDAEITKLLISNGANIDLPNRYGRTPVHITALGKCVNAARVLVDAGADLNLKDQWGDQPLLTAAWSTRNEQIRLLFVQSGASLTDPRLDLNNLLEWAAVEGNEIAVRRLVDAGADVWRKSQFGETAYSIARHFEHEDIANLLLQIARPVAAPNSSSNNNIPQDGSNQNTKTLTQSDSSVENAVSGKERKSVAEGKSSDKGAEKEGAPSSDEKSQLKLPIDEKKDFLLSATQKSFLDFVPRSYIILLALILATAATVIQIY